MNHPFLTCRLCELSIWEALEAMAGQLAFSFHLAHFLAFFLYTTASSFIASSLETSIATSWVASCNWGRKFKINLTALNRKPVEMKSLRPRQRYNANIIHTRVDFFHCAACDDFCSWKLDCCCWLCLLCSLCWLSSLSWLSSLCWLCWLC